MQGDVFVFSSLYREGLQDALEGLEALEFRLGSKEGGVTNGFFRPGVFHCFKGNSHCLVSLGRYLKFDFFLFYANEVCGVAIQNIDFNCAVRV